MTEESEPSYKTSLERDKYTKEEQVSIDYLLDMMFVAKHQILLRRALGSEQKRHE